MAILNRLAELESEIVGFWWPRAYDWEHGGFHGTLDREGRPCAGGDGSQSDKTLVQQARHAWALSAYLERRGPRLSSDRRGALEGMAWGTRAFLARFHDPRDGRYHWQLSRAGELRDATKIVYGQAFAVFALSQFATTFREEEAVDAALACFRAIERFSHDGRHGGYDGLGQPEWLTGGARKDANTHIHLLEGFTALHDAAPEPGVRLRLAELVALVATRLLQPDGHVQPTLDVDFTPLGRPRVSYGHDIETAWLLLDAARSLGSAGQGCVADQGKAAALILGRAALEGGFDRAEGGVFDEGVPGGPVTHPEKVWWAQFEAVVGCWQLFELTGDEHYLDLLERTLDFIEGAARDRTFGEWYWSVLPGGAWGDRGPGKGNPWKTTYHNLRAVLYVSDWIEQFIDSNQDPT